MDADAGWDTYIPSQLDDTYLSGFNGDAQLQDFFSRPVKIATYTWNIGELLDRVFNPWSLFFGDSRVINRINNYNLLRAELQVKFVINGTVFHYGMVMPSYIPIGEYDNLTKVRSGVNQDAIAASQRPHIFLSPTNSLGGTMSLPFFWNANWLSIPSANWSSMGEIEIKSLNKLRHANGGTTPVTITIFARAINVKVSVPTTSSSVALVPQSKDEYGKPIISKMATSVASAMGFLERTPVIGPYAKATGMIATVISSIASAFGYSRPNIITDTQHMRLLTFGNLASTDTADTSFKLTLDTKQELTIDSRTVGLDGQDQMTISYIVTKQSYLNSFVWTVADPANTLLYSIGVTPCLYNMYATSEIHMTPVCFAALPFKYWHGTMKFRFQVVASALHRGRLKIVYDPCGIDPTVHPDYNVAYTRIIDITETSDFEIDVGWANPLAFLEVSGINVTSLPFANLDTVDYLDNHFNGTISVYVVNDLVVPGATTNNEAEINVFVSGGEDMQFANPITTHYSNLSVFENQSGMDTIADLCPTTALPVEEVMHNSTDSHVNDVYFGERIVSFRSCLKRYNKYMALPLDSEALSGDQYVSFTTSNFPLNYGHDPSGVAQYGFPTPKTYNPVFNTLLTYLTPAYVAHRGTIRSKYRLVTSDTHSVSDITVSRTDVQYEPWTLTQAADVTVTNTPSENQLLLLSRTTNEWEGVYKTVNGGYVANEIEFPDYNNKRFTFSRNLLHYATSQSKYRQCHTVHFHVKNESDMDYLERYIAAGEDFSMFFFLAVPIMYVNSFPSS